MASANHRLIDFLLANGLAPDERTARGLIMRGDVLVDDQPVTSPAQIVSPDSEVRIRGRISQPVSRGYDKLAPVFDELGLDVQGRICLDLGVSTGGFSELLLERGAASIYAVDVGYGVVADSIRHRVVLLERTNARELTSQHVPEKLHFVTGDLSFISWQAVIPAVAALLAPEAELLLLVKPQFELASRGRGAELREGIVDSPALRLEALELLWDTWHNESLCPQAVLPSALKGQKGNQEYFVYLANGVDMCTQDQYRELAARAIGIDLS